MGDKNNTDILSEDSLQLVGLVRDLQDSLYTISRYAELGSSGSLKAISRQADASMALLDSYVLACQAERGQLELELSPISLGAVMYEAQYSLSQLLLGGPETIRIQAKVNQPVMTHSDSLKNVLVTTGLATYELAEGEHKQIQLRSFLTANGNIGVGSFAQDLHINQSELRQALENSQSRIRMPKKSNKSGVSLQIADTLCQALGGGLQFKKVGAYGGLVTILPKSNQLAIL